MNACKFLTTIIASTDDVCELVMCCFYCFGGGVYQQLWTTMGFSKVCTLDNLEACMMCESYRWYDITFKSIDALPQKYHDASIHCDYVTRLKECVAQSNNLTFTGICV